MSTNIDEFVYKANPNEWLEISDELNESIEVITNNSKTIFFKSDTWSGKPSKKLMSSRSIFLLMGFSIENLIKGILIFDKPQLVNKGYLENEIKSHNLKNLIIKIKDVDVDNETMGFLEILTDAIPDWGRYPCPLRYQSLKDEVEFTKIMSGRYTNLRRQLRNVLIEKLKKGWVSGLENKRTNVKIINITEKVKVNRLNDPHA